MSFELQRLIQEAACLFGEEVENIARAMERQLTVVGGLRTSARSGGKNARKEGNSIYRLYEMFGPLSEAAKTKLYVGDIERPRGVVTKPTRLRKRLLSVFRRVRIW